MLGGLNGQIESLKRQARAARRYKELSAEIRKAEALLLHLLWTTAHAEVAQSEHELSEVLGRLAVATEAESKALREEAEFADMLQPLREEEATRGVVLNRIRIEQESFEKEAERLAQRQRELEGRAGQLRRDREREEQMLAEAREVIGGSRASHNSSPTTTPARPMRKPRHARRWSAPMPISRPPRRGSPTSRGAPSRPAPAARAWRNRRPSAPPTSTR